jgi:hypothetical protein
VRAAFVLTADDPRGYVAAMALTESIRTTMPGVEVVQLTDATSPPALGIDAVRRGGGHRQFSRFIAESYADCGPGDWLFIDTDAIVQRDVRDVFLEEFDIAVAGRDGTYLPGEEDSDFMAAMPYNAGVVFSRSPAAWHAVAARVAQMSDVDQAWLGCQRALCELIREGAIRAHVLPASYNYPPRSADDPIEEKAIVHYKGPWRKALLWRRIYSETVGPRQPLAEGVP